MLPIILRVLRLSAPLLTAFLFSIPLAPPAPVRAADFTVDTLTDEADGSCGDGDCSLRDAITLAESNAGPDTIEFSVAGTIIVEATLGVLPQLNAGLTVIDGRTAPGYAGTPVVLIDGTNLSGLPGIQFGIAIYSNENAVQGLAIHSFPDGCIEIEEASGNIVEQNVLSDCANGVMMAGTSTGNDIRENYIGTDVTGMSAWGNSHAGVYFNNPPGLWGPTINHIEDNVISGNDGWGIVLWGDQTYQNWIQGNFIGVAADGVSPLGNGAAGIWVAEGAFENYIGGALEGDGNIIAYNASVTPDTGIVITGADSDNNRISHNSIYDNTDLGIDLGDDGVTCNSPSEDGPNDFIPCPVITSASTSAVSGTTCPDCIVEVFIADPDPSGYGEGRTFLGDTETSDGNFAVPVSGVAACDWLTATAIGQNDDYGNTSEFALNVQVPCESQQHNRPTRTPTPTATPAATETPLPPPPPLPTPSGAVGPAVLPPSTGEGPAPDGPSWPSLALLVAAGSALAIGGFRLRVARGRRRDG